MRKTKKEILMPAIKRRKTLKRFAKFNLGFAIPLSKFPSHFDFFKKS
jgi:hypothetical protein